MILLGMHLRKLKSCGATSKFMQGLTFVKQRKLFKKSFAQHPFWTFIDLIKNKGDPVLQKKG